MKVDIRSRNLELTDELRALVIRRVRFSLGRMLTAQSRVSVTLADINGPRGGCDKRVLVRATGPGLPEVVIQADGVELVVALDMAMQRVARACARARDRVRLTTGFARSTPPDPR
jgi:putative sigma-54 modulation protein